jgi:hypothetical protein
MIPLDQHHDHALTKQAALHVNNAERFLKMMEMAVEGGDEGATLAYGFALKEQVEKVMGVASWSMRRNPLEAE